MTVQKHSPLLHEIPLPRDEKMPMLIRAKKRRKKMPKCSTLTKKQPAQKMTTITTRIPKSMKTKLQKKADRYTEGKLSMLVRHALLEEIKCLT